MLINIKCLQMLKFVIINYSIDLKSQNNMLTKYQRKIFKNECCLVTKTHTSAGTIFRPKRRNNGLSDILKNHGINLTDLILTADSTKI